MKITASFEEGLSKADLTILGGSGGSGGEGGLGPKFLWIFGKREKGENGAGGQSALPTNVSIIYENEETNN